MEQNVRVYRGLLPGLIAAFRRGNSDIDPLGTPSTASPQPNGMSDSITSPHTELDISSDPSEDMETVLDEKDKKANLKVRNTGPRIRFLENPAIRVPLTHRPKWVMGTQAKSSPKRARYFTYVKKSNQRKAQDQAWKKKTHAVHHGYSVMTSVESSPLRPSDEHDGAHFPAPRRAGGAPEVSRHSARGHQLDDDHF